MSRPSAFALLIVFGLTAYFGANILRFEALGNRVWFGPADQPVNSALDSVSRWTNTNSVGIAARSLMLDIIMSETPHDTAAIERALEEIAAGSPTSSATWAGIAEVRKARDEPLESVLAAFRMSALTGSHEGYSMMLRAVFGLKYWKELPEQDRQTVARDILISYGEELGVATRYRQMLAAKSEPERASIRAVMLGSGLASERVMRGLGV